MSLRFCPLLLALCSLGCIAYAVEPVPESDAKAWIALHDALAPAGGTWGWLPWKNEDLRDWDTKQRVRSYLYTHLNLGHGTVFSPLQRQGSAFSTNTNCHNMNRHCNWPDWQHWGSTAQSFPAAQKFFFERLLGSGDVLPKGDDGHAH